MKSHTLEPKSRTQETIVHIKRDPVETEKLVLEVSSGSVKENINVFEKRGGCPAKTSSLKATCLKDQEEPENSSSGVSSDVEVERQELRSYDQATLSKRLSAYYLQRRQSAENLVPTLAAPVVSTLESLNQRNTHVRQPASPSPALGQQTRRPPADKSTLGGIPKKTLKIRLDQKVHATRRAEGARAADADCSNLKRSIDESLQFIRLQVDSLGLSSVSEVDVLSDLVPPPPEFSHGVRPQQVEPIAPPPPEFSDEYRKFDPRHPTVYHLNQHPSAYCRYNGSPQHHAATLRPTPTHHHRPIHDVYRPGYGTLGRKTDPHVLVVPIERQAGDLARLKSVQREFRQKPLIEWSARDVSDWLESLFLQEYRPRFIEAGITGVKLANMDSNDFMGLGVKQVGHRVNMERSLRRYMK